LERNYYYYFNILPFFYGFVKKKILFEMYRVPDRIVAAQATVFQCRSHSSLAQMLTRVAIAVTLLIFHRIPGPFIR